MEFQRAGHAAAPTNEIGGASRPSSVSANAEPLRNGMTATGSHEYFYSLRGAQPPGEGIPQRDGTLLRRPTVHPLSHGVAVTAPPAQGSLFLGSGEPLR